MSERSCAIERFLERAGWSDAARAPLAGDASTRAYLRLERGGESAILMDSGGAPVEAFLRVAGHLRAMDLSAPRLLAHDTRVGLVLMEDLGDAVFAQVIARDPACEAGLYAAATDLLMALQAGAVPGWAARYDARAMTQALEPARDWCAGGQGVDWRAFEDAFAEALAATDMLPVLVHRDYHAENLVWRPDRAGVRRVGLLDFQDALVGHPAYDLASLLQDARRDVAPALEARMIARFLDATGHAEAPFRRAYAVQAAQRHVRVLGIFARLAARDGKTRYLSLVPRVRMLLDRDLAHPDLAPLRCLAGRVLPAQAPA